MFTVQSGNRTSESTEGPGNAPLPQAEEVPEREDGVNQTSVDEGKEDLPLDLGDEGSEEVCRERRHSISSQQSQRSTSVPSSSTRRRSLPSSPPPNTAALMESARPRRRSTCSVSSITNSATTSTFRGVLNTKAVLEDLEGSEAYEYGRLLPILLEMQRETPEQCCIRQFLAENCEISPSMLDALRLLEVLESPTCQLSPDFRKSAVFGHFLLVLRELSVSDSTCEQIFRKLRRKGQGQATRSACQQSAQHLCISRFEANMPWNEWEGVLRSAFEGVQETVSYAEWAICCRRCVRIVRLIITLRLVS